MPTIVNAIEFRKNLPKYLKSAGRQPVFIREGRARRVLISEADLERTRPIYIFEDGSAIEPIYQDDPDAELIRKARKEARSDKLETRSLDELEQELQL
ncbi:hypothetical protein KKF38_02195 [Patescibacteria group bacterium]|nr:hypothetical protein [Patescibacteria group bacterium]